MNEQERIRECFCAFIEGSLVSHDNNSVLKLFADDVWGLEWARRESFDVKKICGRFC